MSPDAKPLVMPAPEPPPLERLGRWAGRWAYRARAGARRWSGKLGSESPRGEAEVNRSLERKMALAALGGFVIGLASGWNRGRQRRRMRWRRRHGHPFAP